MTRLTLLLLLLTSIQPLAFTIRHPAILYCIKQDEELHHPRADFENLQPNQSELGLRWIPTKPLASVAVPAASDYFATKRRTGPKAT